MALLIPVALFIVGILCCVGIALVVVRERNNERKSAMLSTQPQQEQQPQQPQQEQLSLPQSSSQPSGQSSLSQPASPRLPQPPQPPQQSPVTTQQPKAGEKPVSSLPITRPLAPIVEKTSEPLHTGPEATTPVQKSTLPDLAATIEMEQLSQLFQDGRLSPEWWREQFQELSVKVQDMREQSGLIERHIAILNQIAVHMAELEQVRHEYTRLRERRLAVLRIPKRLQEQHEEDDTYIHTDKRPAMKRYTLKTM